MAQGKKRDYQRLALAISVFSLIVSITAGVFSWRTYFTAYRPYVGVRDVKITVIGEPADTIIWEYVIYNHGSVPALIRASTKRTRLLDAGKELPIPHEDTTLTEQTHVLLPGHEARNFSRLKSNPELIRKVVNGDVTVEADVTVPYESVTSLWKSTYAYRARYQSRRFYSGVFFTAVWAKMD